MIAKYGEVLYAFTLEEKIELLKYETLLLFEASKAKLEWFLYGLVAIIWAGVFYCFVSLVSIDRHYKDAVHEPVKIERSLQKAADSKKAAKEKKQETISKISEGSKRSSLKPEAIYDKVFSYTEAESIDPYFVLALIEKECGFAESAKAKLDYAVTGSKGWSQARDSMWETFRNQYVMSPKGLGLSKKEADAEWSFEEAPNDPDKSLVFICWCLKWLKRYWPEKTSTPYDLYKTYNQGPYGKDSKLALDNAAKFIKIYDRYKN